MAGQQEIVGLAGGGIPSGQPSTSGSAILVVKRGLDTGSQLFLDRPVTSIGRQRYSDIFLDDASVSRHHAELRSDNGHFRIVDLRSLNGVYVNHNAVQTAVLADGDEIHIGKFRFVFLARTTAVDPLGGPPREHRPQEATPATAAAAV